MDEKDIINLLIPLGGSGGIGAFILWLVKTWISRLHGKLDELAKAVVEIDKKLAKEEGLQTGKTEVIWSQLNTDKRKIAEIQSSQQKLWETISRIVNTERTSDPK